MKIKNPNPTNSQILFFGIVGLICSFALKFSLVETTVYARNLSGFSQIFSCVLLSYFNCDKRRNTWKGKRNSPKSKRNFILFSFFAFSSALIFLALLYQHPIISWLLETSLSILLGLCVSINDVIVTLPKKKKK